MNPRHQFSLLVATVTQACQVQTHDLPGPLTALWFHPTDATCALSTSLDTAYIHTFTHVDTRTLIRSRQIHHHPAA